MPDLIWQLTIVATVRAVLLAKRATWLDLNTYLPPVVRHDGDVIQ